MHVGRQVGVLQHLGIAADGGKRRAQLVGNIANEFGLAFLAHGEFFLPHVCVLCQLFQAIGQLICLAQASFSGEHERGAFFTVAHLLRELAQRLGQEVPNNVSQQERGKCNGHYALQKRTGCRGAVDGMIEKHGKARGKHCHERGKNCEVKAQVIHCFQLS